MHALALSPSALRSVAAAAVAAPFAFDPSRKAASVTLSVSNTKATATAAGTYANAFATAAVDTSKTYAFTINAVGSGTIGFGAGNGSASNTVQLGTDANSVTITQLGDVYANSVLLGSPGITYTTGDVIRMQFTATQVRFSKNGGAYSALYTHGLTGTLTPAVCVHDTGDAITGAIE